MKALKEIVEKLMSIIKNFNKQETVYNSYLNIVKNSNIMINYLTDEDIKSMVELLYSSLDRFGELIQTQSDNLTVDWVDGMREFFGTYYEHNKVNKKTIDVSIANLLHAQLKFANEYMGYSINTKITETVVQMNTKLNQGAPHLSTETKDDETPITVNDNYTVLKVLIRSLVCTLQMTTQAGWNFKTALVEGCILISHLLEGNIFKQDSFYNTFKRFVSSVTIFGIGASFGIVFASNYVVTYATSYTSNQYQELKSCKTLIDLNNFVERTVQTHNTYSYPNVLDEDENENEEEHHPSRILKPSAKNI